MWQFDSKINFKGTREITAHLDIYSFWEGTNLILYCPALDMSAYGENEEDAKHNFETVYSEYIDYCMSKKTLVADLKNHGWNIKSLKQKRIKSPSFEELMNNETLFDILKSKQYKRVMASVEMPLA